MEGVGITSINKNAWRGVVSGLVMMGNSGALIEQRDTTYLQDTTLRLERIRRREKKGGVYLLNQIRPCQFEIYFPRYFRDVLVSGGERLGLLHRSLGQDGVDALRVRQLHASRPGRQVVNPPPPPSTGITEVVKDYHDYVINQIFWCVRSFYKKEMS